MLYLDCEPNTFLLIKQNKFEYFYTDVESVKYYHSVNLFHFIKVVGNNILCGNALESVLCDSKHTSSLVETNVMHWYSV